MTENPSIKAECRNFNFHYGAFHALRNINLTVHEKQVDKLALAKRDAIVMHPGPMNRGVEIDSPVADGPHSVILPQVTFGIAVRMAVMSIVAGN